MKLPLWILLTTASCFAVQIPITDTTGRTIHVDDLSLKDGVLKATRHDGKSVQIPLSRLDAASRKLAFDELDRIEIEREKAEAAKPKGIVVTSTAVKRVDVSAFGGKFRYFFTTRNHDPIPWKGEVKIILLNKSGDWADEATFKVDTKANGAAGGFFESPMGPPSVHGDHGVTAYLVRVTGPDGKQRKFDAVAISDKYSDALGE